MRRLERKHQNMRQRSKYMLHVEGKRFLHHDIYKCVRMIPDVLDVRCRRCKASRILPFKSLVMS
jgi:hypothetical protein